MPAIVEEPPVAYRRQPATAATRDFEATETPVPRGVGAGKLPVAGDPRRAAGPGHAVELSDDEIRFVPLDGAPQTVVSTSVFFVPLDPVHAPFGLRVAYDPMASRFVLAGLERQDDCPTIGDVEESSRILLAVSADADPIGRWLITSIPSKLQALDAPSGRPVDVWADDLTLAVGEESIEITAGMRTFGDGRCVGLPSGRRSWRVEKGAAGDGFYSGGTARVVLLPGGGDSTE